jgi:hypothetical protein
MILTATRELHTVYAYDVSEAAHYEGKRKESIKQEY